MHWDTVAGVCEAVGKRLGKRGRPYGGRRKGWKTENDLHNLLILISLVAIFGWLLLIDRQLLIALPPMACRHVVVLPAAAASQKRVTQAVGYV